MNPFFTKKLDISGYNACICAVPTGYYGFVRVVEFINGNCKNKIAYFTLSKSFETTSFTFLTDNSGRTVNKGWSSGPEDPRINSNTEFFAVTNDTNTCWKSDFSKITLRDAEIIEVKPYAVSDIPRQGEKNWLLLNTFGTDQHFLHSLNPLRIVRMDARSCKGNVIMETRVPDLSGILHNGACVNLGPRGFLISARVKRGIFYDHSRWILLDPSYTFQCLSPPFWFEPSKWISSDGGYEMNMSLHLEEDDALVCCVGRCDSYNIVNKYKLKDVLEFVHTGNRGLI